MLSTPPPYRLDSLRGEHFASSQGAHAHQHPGRIQYAERATAPAATAWDRFT